MTSDMHWEVLEKSRIADCRVFSVHEMRSQNVARHADKQYSFYVLDCPNWVNIIPVTPEGNVILIEQFRHGLGEVVLEIPGGMVDEGEEPGATAARELQEETGFAAEEIVYLGFNHPNPAIQGNRCFSYLARNVKKVSQPHFDTTEHIVTREVPLVQIPQLIADGTISHALVITAFHMLDLLNKK